MMAIGEHSVGYGRLQLTTILAVPGMSISAEENDRRNQIKVNKMENQLLTIGKGGRQATFAGDFWDVSFDGGASGF